MATGFDVGEGGGGNLKDRQKLADSKVYSRKSFKGFKTYTSQEDSRDLPYQIEQNPRRDRGFDRFEAASEDSSSLKLNHQGGKNNINYSDMQTGNGIGVSGFPENRVLVSLGYNTKKERRDLRRKLEDELSLVKGVVKKLERCGNNLRPLVDEAKNNSGKLKRVHSEVGSVGWHEGRQVDQLRVTVPEHSQGVSDNVEKEKRTPKANPLYQSSDFISGKERIPPSEQNKKPKVMGKKNGDSGSGTGMGNQSSKVFKNCSLLLDKLMKHKHGWVFNIPVDAKALGLHDYFTIIQHPMDLGTVKSRLNTNWYKSPKEFAEDVRLTFQNAMKYNPKGHDVHVMAEILLTLFEEKWGSIEAEYMQELKALTDRETSLSTPTSKKASLPAPPPPPPPSGDLTKTLDRAESITNPVAAKPKIPHSTRGRKPVPKKPKAKDPNKRDMTYIEKQKLSTELQNLPSEKLDNVVQIIRKRNPSLCQNDDEIEVDIDSVDTETLWELDRFVLYYKKSINKIKKSIEVTQVAGDEPTTDKEQAPSVGVEPNETKTAVEKDALVSPPGHDQNQGGNANKSHTSGSSSSDSGSSSSGSDSDSSSA